MDETIKQIRAYLLQCASINGVWFSDRIVTSVKELGLWEAERGSGLETNSNLQTGAEHFHPGPAHSACPGFEVCCPTIYRLSAPNQLSYIKKKKKKNV